MCLIRFLDSFLVVQFLIILFNKVKVLKMGFFKKKLFITFFLLILLDSAVSITVFSQTSDMVSSNVLRESKVCILHNSLYSFNKSDTYNDPTSPVYRFYPSYSDKVYQDKEEDRLILVGNCRKDKKGLFINVNNLIVCDTFNFIPTDISQENRLGGNKMDLIFRPGEKITLFKSHELTFYKKGRDKDIDEKDFINYLYEFSSDGLKKVMRNGNYDLTLEKLFPNANEKKIYAIKFSDIENSYSKTPNYKFESSMLQEVSLAGDSVLFSDLNENEDTVELSCGSSGYWSLEKITDSIDYEDVIGKVEEPLKNSQPRPEYSNISNNAGVCLLHNNLYAVDENTAKEDPKQSQVDTRYRFFPSSPDNREDRLILVSNCNVVNSGDKASVVCDTFNSIPNFEAISNLENRFWNENNDAIGSKMKLLFQPDQKMFLFKSHKLTFHQDGDFNEQNFISYLYELSSNGLKRVLREGEVNPTLKELFSNINRKIYALKFSEIKNLTSTNNESTDYWFDSLMLDEFSSALDIGFIQTIENNNSIEFVELSCSGLGYWSADKKTTIINPIDSQDLDNILKKADKQLLNAESIGPLDDQMPKERCGSINQPCCHPDALKKFIEDENKIVGLGIIKKIPFIGEDIYNYLEQVNEYTGEIINKKYGPNSEFSAEKYCLQGVPMLEYDGVRRMLSKDDVESNSIEYLNKYLGCRCSDKIDSEERVLNTASFNYCNNLNNISLTNKCYINIDQCSKVGGFYSALGCISPSLEGLFGLISGILLSLVGTFSVLCLVYAGFLVQTSSGNTDQVSKARQIAVRCLTGLLVIIFVSFILDTLFRVLFGDTIFKFLLF
ncbi:MAG: hypothetical protein KatS3mg090_0157 [Patescibacteria group bacterium]|nr:MAG: hypothetical protein KatS3mg090_0157 [Patescibacteria group bacterium]